MELLDFSDRSNRFIPLDCISADYLEALKQLVKNSVYYPRFHIAPPHGLMNDPNGLCQIDGWYHIFYQWFPLGPVHGLKHWYHVKTRDFVRYVDEGPALFPDSELDAQGCFTGVANQENGQWYIYYTGVANGIQQVCRAAFSPDSGFGPKELCVPWDASLTSHEFRDPCIYRNQYMAVGAQSPEGKGIIPIFERRDQGFQAAGVLQLPEALSGYMLECPNLAPLDENTDLLIFSPMGVTSPDRFTFRNVFSVAYGVGRFQPDSLRFDCENYYELDSGFDFYAPQVFQDEMGRLVLFGWFGNSKCVYPSDFEQWAHMMTLPREIRYKEDRIQQIPLEELTALRTDTQSLQEMQVLDDSCFELDFDAYDTFRISISNPKGEELVFSGSESEYCLNREKTTHLYNQNYGTSRFAHRNCSRGRRVRIFVDRSAIEIFADDGFVVFTSRFYLDNITTLNCSGVNGQLYYLRPMEIIAARNDKA